MINIFKRKINDPIKPCGIKSTCKPEIQASFNEVFLNAHLELNKKSRIFNKTKKVNHGKKTF